MLEESDAGLWESEDEEECGFSPPISEDDTTSDSADEPASGGPLCLACCCRELEHHTSLRSDSSISAADLTFGTTLRVTGEFFSDSPTVPADVSDYAYHLRNAMRIPWFLPDNDERPVVSYTRKLRAADQVNYRISKPRVYVLAAATEAQRSSFSCFITGQSDGSLAPYRRGPGATAGPQGRGCGP
ncbi:hypothetical protein MTO96_000046 [Rhipicephalus appendiculatus]